ncbi:unnamed protein product [Ectocarpus sp. 8 AP-2014]
MGSKTCLHAPLDLCKKETLKLSTRASAPARERSRHASTRWGGRQRRYAKGCSSCDRPREGGGTRTVYTRQRGRPRRMKITRICRQQEIKMVATEHQLGTGER